MAESNKGAVEPFVGGGSRDAERGGHFRDRKRSVKAQQNRLSVVPGKCGDGVVQYRLEALPGLCGTVLRMIFHLGVQELEFADFTLVTTQQVFRLHHGGEVQPAGQ